MPIFDDETIIRFSNYAEEQFAAQTGCIVDRFSLPIVLGTATYTLPEYVTDVRRVTWRGRRVIPLIHRKYREGNYPVSAQSEPREYLFNNIAQQTIQFFPTPAETIPQALTGLYGSAIETSVIIEFARTPDFSSFTIPIYFRRFLLKAYVNKMCFSLESRGQNIKAAKYFDAKWKQLLADYTEVLEDLLLARKIVASTYQILKPRPPRPVLPASFGTYID